MGAVSPAVVVPVLVVIIVGVVMVLGWRWYRRTVADLGPEASPPVRGTRLTAEALRTLDSPPWRVVHEIGEHTLGPVDHVVVGPPGAIAIETSVGEPLPTSADLPDAHDAQAVAAAAIVRADVDELLHGSGVACGVLARVRWAASDSPDPSTVEVMPGVVAVQGARLVEWLDSLPAGDLTPSQIDLAWQRLAIGIGRPDPLP